MKSPRFGAPILIALSFGFFGHGAQAQSGLFLETARWAEAGARTSPARISDSMEQAGRDPSRYLSLGETHLFPQAGRPLLRSFAEKFFRAANVPVDSCHESLGADFRTGPFGQLMRFFSRSVLETTRNSPSNTDFRACSDPQKKWFTYSGLFHQWALPQLFPHDFALTAVSTQPGNTIFTQLPSARGVFLAALDAIYLENQATVAVIRETISQRHGLATFRNRVAQLVEAQHSFRASTQDFTDPSNSPYRVRGVLLDPSTFGVPADPTIVPEDAAILVTDLDLRIRADHGLLLLRGLAALSDPELQLFLNSLQDGRVRQSYSSLLQFLKAGENALSPIRYGTIQVELPPGSEFWILNAVRPNLEHFTDAIVAATPRVGSSPQLRCFSTTDSDMPMKESACWQLWRSSAP